MNNKDRTKRLWFILICVYCIFGLIIPSILANDIQLTYLENDATFITGTSPKVGSNANLGIYPHWCLGNISKCSDGITVSFFIKPKKAVETSPEIVIITSGGHSFFSEGFYLLQKYGDQYEFGVSKQDNVWRQNFRLLPDLWANIFASWNDSAGLKLYVDGYLTKRDDPEKREFEDDSFDPFSEIVIGIDGEGLPINNTNLFDIDNLVIFNSMKSLQEYSIDERGYYLGCKLQSSDEGSSLDLSTSKNAVHDCRAHCDSPLVEISSNDKCRCLNLDALKLVITDDRCTSGSEVGKIYSVSGRTTAHSFHLNATVNPLHSRPYTKPLETVRIEIETSFVVMNNIDVNFGDGLSMSTKQKVLSHFWASEGVFTITISTTIGDILLRKTVDFEVKDVDEGIPPEMLVVSANHLQVQLSAEYQFLSFGEYDTECSVRYGDGHIFHQSHKSGYLNALYVNHTYDLYGQYLIDYNCSNAYGETRNSTRFVSRLFDIPFIYHNMEEPFIFRIHGSESYLENLNVFRNDVQKLNSTVQVNGILINSLDLQPYENLVTINNGDITLIKRIFYVQHLVQKATIAPIKRSNAWYLTTNITIKIPAGLETFINCSFGIGDNYMFYIDKSDVPLGMLFEVEYPSLGYYPVIVDMTNDISTSRGEDLISVEVPIVTIKLSTSNITDKTLPVILKVDLNGDSPGPDKVEFNIRHGDGHADDVSYRSPTKQKFTTFQNKYIYENWGIYSICVTARNQISEVFQCILVQVGQNLTHVDLKTSTTGRVLQNDYAEVNITSYTGSDVTYDVYFGSEKFTFTDKQLESGNVTVESDIDDSNNTLTDEIVSDESESSAGLLTTIISLLFDQNSTTTSPLSPSKTTTTTEPITRASEVENDRKRRSVAPRPKFYAFRVTDDIITVGHLFLKSGRFRVKARVRNSFSAVRTELCQTIIVDDVDDKNCPKPKIDFENVRSSVNSPIRRIRSEEFNITVVSESSCVSGSQFTYSWKAEKFNKGKLEPISEVCSMESNNNVLVIPAVYLSYGVYRLKVSVAPLGHSLRSTEKQVFLSIEASNPYAEIAGEQETDFLIYANAVFDLNPSRDPDLVTKSKTGLEFDLICIKSDNFDQANTLPFQQLKSKSTLIFQDKMMKESTGNPVKLYDNGDCFMNVENMTKSVSTFDGRLSFPAEYFAAEEFVMKLYVSKEGRVNSTNQRVKIKLTNSTDIKGQLDAMSSIKDCGSLLRAVAVVSGEFLTGGNDTSDDQEEELTEVREFMTGLLDNLADKTENLDQCKGVASAVADLTSNPDQTSSSSRSSGGSAVNKSMTTMKEKFGNANFDSVKDASASAVTGMSNLLPKEDKAEVEAQKRRKKREAAQNPDHGLTEGNQEETDSYDLIMEEEDANLHRFFDDLYEYVFIFKKAFRRAVKNYYSIMWINKEAALADAEQFFRKVIIEWEPFDVERYLLKYCKHEKYLLDRDKLKADKAVASAGTGAVDSISGLLLGKMEASRRRRRRRSLPGNGTQAEAEIEGEDNLEQECAINAPGMGLGLKNIDPDQPGPAQMSSSFGSFEIPEGVIPKSSDGGGVGTTLVTTKGNPKTWGSNSNGIKSSVLSLDLSGSGGGSKMKVNNTKAPMRLMIQGKAEDVPAPSQWMLCVPRGVSPKDATQWNNHPVPVTENDTALHFLLWPERKGDKFNVYFKFKDRPNATHYDYKTMMPHDPTDFPGYQNKDPEVLNQLLHTFYPPQNMTKLNGTYWVSIGIAKTDVDFGSSETCLNYSTQTFVPSCKFWDEETETWKGDGCKVGNGTTKWNTECLCTHLTSFGGDFAVPPNTIDFSNVWAKFANLNENAAVFSTVISLIGVYIMLLIWSRYMDKRDIIKWGATPLEDNLPSDNYHYQMTVQTGVRKNASTTSKVSFIVSGENGDSGVRRLYDGHRKVLESGSILNYICSVEKPLGSLTFMRIWHDNSGRGKQKSWFLDQVQITDLQTGDRYIFLCDRWLALEEDDGMVDRILPVAGLEDLVAFKQLFSANVRKKLSNEHLWFSVFSRPTKSSFTRAQRISCCMSLLFMTMITNAMWFKSDDNAKQSQALKVGPVSFTVQQFFVSFASTMLVFPVNFILITFFKKCRPKQNAVIQKHQQQPKRGKWKNVTNGSQIWGDAEMPSRWKRFKDYISDLINFKQKAKYGADDDIDEDDAPKTRIVGVPEDEKEKKKKKKKPGTLPHWCIYIAWVLCFFSITSAGFFTILYSLEWGKEKANEWLTTFLLSFFQSVIVVQPIKVMFLVAFIACILKKPALDEEDTNEDLNNVIAAHDEEFIGKDNGTIEEIAAKRKEANAEFQPPDPSTLEEARQQRLIELKMEEVLKELSSYIFFVIILFFLSYQQRDSNSYTYATNLKNTFTHNFESITTVDQYWVWLENKLIPSLYATHYHNGTKIRRWWEKRCINDMASRRVGIPRLRQLRVKPDTCTVNKYMRELILHCRDEYGWSDDDAKIYLPRWQKPDKENITELTKPKNPGPWVYQSSVKLANAPYMATMSTYKGGGYVYMFERNVDRTKQKIDELKNQIWMDAHTRAIFLEFTVYNPNINLFGSMIMVIEFLHSGGAIPRLECKVFRLLSYVGGLGIMVMIAEVIYAIFSLYFFIRCIRKVRKEKMKYFKGFWNKLEFALLCFCIAVIAMYALKQILTTLAMNALKDPDKADYVNFQSLALYDEMYGFMCGFVVFLATVQFLKLLQFNKKMGMLGETVQYATKDLKVFSIAFLLYFWTFTATGFLLFSNSMISYSNVVGAAESMFAFTLGSFDFVAMQSAQPTLGPIFFFAFILVVYVGLMSIFLTIIADAFSTVKENLEGKQNDYEFLDYFTKRLKQVMGFA